MSFIRWEYGSEFAWVSPSRNCYEEPIFPPNAVLYGTGRQALAAVLTAGKKIHGWRRCHVPSYICESVVEAVKAADLICIPYRDSPVCRNDAAWTELTSSDCVLVVNHFGWRSPEISKRVRETPAGLVEDHTHDPWSRWAVESTADYCIVSLRKTLPLPDGGAAWSPRGHPIDIPPGQTPAHQRAALHKLSAMLLKAFYLADSFSHKDLYRSLQIEGENLFSPHPCSRPLEVTPYLLAHLPWKEWRKRRADNVTYLASQLRNISHQEVLNPEVVSTSCPFGVVIRCTDETTRERLRHYLIKKNIYPAVLWPEHSHMISDPAAVDLSRRTLFFHADFRYTFADLDKVIEAVRQFFAHE